jgi:hypothetical protein
MVTYIHMDDHYLQHTFEGFLLAIVGSERENASFFTQPFSFTYYLDEGGGEIKAFGSTTSGLRKC